MDGTKIFDQNEYVIFIQHDTPSNLFPNVFEPALTAIAVSTDVDVKPVYQLGSYNVKGFSFGGMLITGEIYALQDAASAENFDTFLDTVSTSALNRNYDFVNQRTFDFKIFSANMFKNSIEEVEMFMQVIKNVRVFNRTESKNANDNVKVLKYSFVQEKQYRQKLEYNDETLSLDNMISLDENEDYVTVLNNLKNQYPELDIESIEQIMREIFPVHTKMSTVLQKDKNVLDIINKIN